MALLVGELRRGGYELTFERVDTGAGMTAALDKNQWDLVIRDYSMPHFSGMDALKLLRAKGSEVPSNFVSGTIGEETAVAALRLGAQDYVMKNNLKRFLPAIQRELQEAAQRRERKRLEHQVQELQKFEAIGRLAGGIAHDFNNALGVILGWAQLGYDNVPDNRPVRENFRMIRDQAQRSAGLTRTKSTTWSRTSCGTQLPVRGPQVFFLARRAPPSTRPGLRPWSGPSSPRTQSVSVSPPPGDGDAPQPEKQPLRSRRTPFASGRTPSAAGPVPHTGPRRAPCPKGVASRWLLSLLRCNASVPSSYVRSAILTEERFLHFQLRQDIFTSQTESADGTSVPTLPVASRKSSLRKLLRAAPSLHKSIYVTRRGVLVRMFHQQTPSVM